MQRNLKQLTDLQAIRRALQAQKDAEHKAQREQALEEARLFTQLAESEGVAYDPATDYPDQNGFVFTTAEIARYISA